MNNYLTVAAIQMISTTNWLENLKAATKLITSAAQKGARLVILPEFFIRIANNQDRQFIDLIEPLGKGKIQTHLANLAKNNNIYLVAGTIPIQNSTSPKCYNTAIVYDPQGQMICHYHKIHLFKFNDGTLKFDESDTFYNGKNICTFKVDDFSFGLGICYDLRFPELFRNMVNIDGIILPAAFTYHTGKDHWEILLRARAIENQCYVIAAAQGGKHENGRHTFGHSMIIDPWGHVQSVLANDEGLVIDTLDKAIIKQIRSHLPALQNRQL